MVTTAVTLLTDTDHTVHTVHTVQTVELKRKSSRLSSNPAVDTAVVAQDGLLNHQPDGIKPNINLYRAKALESCNWNTHKSNCFAVIVTHILLIYYILIRYWIKNVWSKEVILKIKSRIILQKTMVSSYLIWLTLLISHKMKRQTFGWFDLFFRRNFYIYEIDCTRLKTQSPNIWLKIANRWIL